MKLKELHIRNIASVERADIDFDNDLTDGLTGDAASIFLISGDTGAGKSVILDSIAMALYKKTPRIADVANASKNDYTDAEGEQLRVASIEQYTRLGISDKDESYSEVVFEGNDGRTYHARLKLGMRLGTKDKTTGIRPMKHRKPVWEIRTDNADWTKDSVEQTILQAVGLDFQQFGRMAMLAQGQFANFLTGDKKEREAILEQLTNTQLFSAYGEAISSLWSKAKKQQDNIQTIYDTEKPHTLSDEEVEQLQKELTEGKQQQTALDRQIQTLDDRLKLVGLAMQNIQVQQEARRQQEQLLKVVADEKYRQSKALCIDWDTSTQQRQQLALQQKAKGEGQQAERELRSLYDDFEILSADMAQRQTAATSLCDAMLLNRQWLEKRKPHEGLFAKAGEADVKIDQYQANLRNAQQKEQLLGQERSTTATLCKAEQDAKAKADEADEAVRAKEDAVNHLRQQREKLRPQAISDALSAKETYWHKVGELRKAYETLLLNRKDADGLRDEIQREETRRQELKTTYEKTDADYIARKKESEKADKRLNTMKMSVNDTIVNLRHRLRDEHTETCPLCGGTIDHDHLDDDFADILTPLEEEQRQAHEALKTATRRRDETKEAFAMFDGALQNKRHQLDKADKKNADDGQQLEASASLVGMKTQEPLIPQIERALTAAEADIARMKASLQEAERLQTDINRLETEKKPLNDAKVEAEKTKAKAENAVKTNAENIARLTREHQQLLSDGMKLKTEIDSLLADYDADWLKHTETTRQQLKADAQEYQQHQQLLNSQQSSYNSMKTLTDSLSQMQETIRQSYQSSLPEIMMSSLGNVSRSTVPASRSQEKITTEWTSLLGQVKTLTGKILDSRAAVSTATEQLQQYYRSTGKTEQTLITLSAQEEEVGIARRFVTTTDSQLKSRTDAISDAQRQIDSALKALALDDLSQLPDPQQLLGEKSAINTQRDELLSRMAQMENRLTTHQNNIRRLREIEGRLAQAKQRFARWDKLNRIFGGTRFRTLVQTYILRPLLNNANIYLRQITDRYSLTCSEDNEQLSILVLDAYNKNQVRSVTVLSGGERFMISLALSLALSSLNRPDMNVNILFIDEGFGTLDEKSLDSVMSTLEKLQEIAGQTNRRVGIISHREELDERIPVKIQVVKKGEGRSLVEVNNSFSTF
ncbi:MAG: SMC family ATPase [Prevotella sp.]|nr:SMC family ATPase [Prevotella sp.]